MNMISGGNDAISQVRAGMRVVDADGTDVGKVKDVLMGDPEAVTTEGAVGTDDLPGGAAGKGPAMPHTDRARLLRTGYVVVRSGGLMPKQRFASAEEIAEVHGDVVQLTVPERLLAS